MKYDLYEISAEINAISMIVSGLANQSGKEYAYKKCIRRIAKSDRSDVGRGVLLLGNGGTNFPG